MSAGQCISSVHILNRRFLQVDGNGTMSEWWMERQVKWIVEMPEEDAREGSLLCITGGGGI